MLTCAVEKEGPVGMIADMEQDGLEAGFVRRKHIKIHVGKLDHWSAGS